MMTDSHLKQEWLEKVKVQFTKNVDGGKRSLSTYTVNTSLHDAPEEIQSDYDVNLQAALIGQEFLWNIHKDLRNDKNFILNLIQNNYTRDIYAYLSDELKNDIELFNICVSRKDAFKWGINKSILENRELIFDAMKTHDIYDKLKDHYHLDKEIVGIHLQNNPEAFVTLKKSVKNYFCSPKRKDFVIDLFKKHISSTKLSYIYKELPLELRENLELIDSFLSSSPYNMEYLPNSLKNDKAFNLYAIGKYNIRKVSSDLINDRDIVEAIVSKNGEHLKFFQHFKNDLAMIRLALKTYSKIDLLSNEMLLNKDLVLEFLKANPANSTSILERTKQYHDDFDVMKLCVEFKGSLLKNSNTLINNPELSELALASTGDFSFISQEHLKKKNLVLQLLENKENCKKAIANNDFIALYSNHYDIAEKIITADPTYISHFPTFKADKEFVKLAMKKGLTDIQAIDSSLYSDKELAIKFCQCSLNNYRLLPISMKNDHDVSLAAIQTPYYYSTIALNSNLSDDTDFIIKAIYKEPLIYKELSNILPAKTDPQVIIGYINSCNIKDKEINLPKSVFDFYGISDPIELKSFIMKKILDESLPQKGNESKKIKI